MFDLIKLRIDNLPEHKFEQVVIDNKLQTNSKAGVIYYDNDRTQNIIDGFYMKVTPKIGRIDINCSLHKFWNWKHIHKQVNHNIFTMNDAIGVIKILSEVTGVDVWTMRVTYYEIGLNIYLTNNCSQYMDLMQTIGTFDKKKTLYVNPKYKGETVLITEFYNLIKRVYKVYDKVAEMQNKNQSVSDGVNIMRIETIRKRIENVLVDELFKPPNLLRLTDSFLSDWRTLQFDNCLNVPKGTHQWKVDLCKDILRNGLESALNNVDQKGRTPKQIRLSREFIKYDWNDFKKSVKVIQSPQELEYRKVLYDTLRMTTYRQQER